MGELRHATIGGGGRGGPFLLVVMYFLAGLTLFVDASSGHEHIHHYDGKSGKTVVIGGGSLAAFATAITLANLSFPIPASQLLSRESSFYSVPAALVNSSNSNSDRVKIVLLEPTDWPGGQLTASNVPPDFGSENFNESNLPRSFVNLLLAVAGPTWDSNPGLCWVSYKCFEADVAAEVMKHWLSLYSPVLHVYYNTVVKDTKVEDGRIVEISAVERQALYAPNAGEADYRTLYSREVRDWYDVKDSDRFTKKVHIFHAPDVVIEATEYSDILVTSKMASYSQGIEYPTEESDEVDSTCGQSTVFPFYMSYRVDNAYISDTTPSGDEGGYPFSMNSLTWDSIWTYRRAKTYGDDPDAVVMNDESNQNLDNDFANGYLFVSGRALEKEASSNWYGGLNVSTLSNAESRSYGWYHYLKNLSALEIGDAHMLLLNHTQVNTSHGLAKVPYLRDTRRSKYGVEHFRLLYSHLNYSTVDANSGLATAYHFHDTVAIGVYHYADIHPLKPGVCALPYPEYITCCTHPVNPYYIPFRAITNEQIVNLLIPGKGMSQSFLANAATRLHPTEWSTGVAAGAAAYMMIAQGEALVPKSGGQGNSEVKATTADVYRHVEALQRLLESAEIQSPLSWVL
jgi:hypothetical protein